MGGVSQIASTAAQTTALLPQAAAILSRDLWWRAPPPQKISGVAPAMLF